MKRRGFPFSYCPIPGNSDLFRISSFGFRISGSAGLLDESDIPIGLAARLMRGGFPLSSSEGGEGNGVAAGE